jgi:hypothetical protein
LRGSVEYDPSGREILGETEQTQFAAKLLAQNGGRSRANRRLFERRSPVAEPWHFLHRRMPPVERRCTVQFRRVRGFRIAIFLSGTKVALPESAHAKPDRAGVFSTIAVYRPKLGTSQQRRLYGHVECVEASPPEFRPRCTLEESSYVAVQALPLGSRCSRPHNPQRYSTWRPQRRRARRGRSYQ